MRYKSNLIAKLKATFKKLRIKEESALKIGSEVPIKVLSFMLCSRAQVSLLHFQCSLYKYILIVQNIGICLATAKEVRVQIICSKSILSTIKILVMLFWKTT